MNTALIEIKAVTGGYEWVSKPIKGSEMTEQFIHGTFYVIKAGDSEYPVLNIEDGAASISAGVTITFGEDYSISVDEGND